MKKKTEDTKLIDELTADLQRTRADFENYRKQIEAQKENERKATRLATVYKLLPLLDDLDRAIANYPELKALEKSLQKTQIPLFCNRHNPVHGCSKSNDKEMVL